MTVWVDSKGKVFTNVVQKDDVPVIIQTPTGQVHGRVYVYPDHRLIDELNGEAHFIAVTEARLFGPNGEVARRIAFLALNKAHVIWIAPDEEVESSHHGE